MALEAFARQNQYIPPEGIRTASWVKAGEPVVKFVKSLIGKGASRDDVWRESAKEFGRPSALDLDNFVKTEISDKDAVFNDNWVDIENIDLPAYGHYKPMGKSIGSLRADELLYHPELYDYDPRLKDSTVDIFNKVGSGTSGAFFGLKPKSGVGYVPSIGLAVDQTGQRGKEVLLHELEHGHHELNNMSRGTSDDAFMPSLFKQEFGRFPKTKLLNYGKFREAIDAKGLKPNDLDGWFGFKGHGPSEIGFYTADGGQYTLKDIGLTEKQAADALQFVGTINDAPLAGLRNELNRAKFYSSDPIVRLRGYHHSVGEDNAKNTMGRSNMSIEEMIAKPRWETRPLTNAGRNPAYPESDLYVETTEAPVNWYDLKVD